MIRRPDPRGGRKAPGGGAGGGVASRVRAEAARLGIPIDATQAARMEEHFALVQRWNRAVGLTAARDPGRGAAFYCEALQILDQFDPEPGGQLLDLGSGAGYPGVALSILRPTWDVLLAERGVRKVAFLQEAARRLALARVSVLEIDLRRAHDLPPQVRPDRLTSKAVGEFGLTLDLLEHRGSERARAIVLTGERGAAGLEREVGRRGGRIRLLERRLIAGRERSWAIVLECAAP